MLFKEMFEKKFANVISFDMRDEICMYERLSLQWASLTYFKKRFYPLVAGKYNVVIHY